MKASAIADSIRRCIAIYGDRDLQYLGKTKNPDGKTFIEDITTITFSTKLNGRLMTDEELAKEPFIMIGNSAFSGNKPTEIRLNWIGRLFKRFIVIK